MPDVLLVGAGEGTLLVAEQFALDELVGKGGAVEGVERLVLPWARVVYRLGDEVLSRTVGTDDSQQLSFTL